jgi:hypothetical protein
VGGTDGKPINEIWCERVKMGSVRAIVRRSVVGWIYAECRYFVRTVMNLGGGGDISLTTRVTTQCLVTLHQVVQLTSRLRFFDGSNVM